MHSPETHRVLRKAAASLQEILTNPASSLIIFFSFKKLFPLVPQLPPGDPTVLWKIQAGNQAWECWVQVAVFPSLKLFSGGGFCLFFFFFSFKRGVPATKGSFFYRAIPSLSLTFFLFAPFLPSFLTNSESLDATIRNPARSTNPAPGELPPKSGATRFQRNTAPKPAALALPLSGSFYAFPLAVTRRIPR